MNDCFPCYLKSVYVGEVENGSVPPRPASSQEDEEGGEGAQQDERSVDLDTRYDYLDLWIPVQYTVKFLQNFF